MFDYLSMEIFQCPFVLDLSGGQVFMLIAAIQLLCRHPGFQGPTREFVEAFARKLQASLSVSPQLRGSIEMGWDPVMDIPREPTVERRIITP